MATKKTSKNAEKFICENCDFKCNKKSDWQRHISRKKHLINKNDVFSNKKNAKNAKPLNYTCIMCNKIYKCRSGLWRHKKICQKLNNITINQNDESGELKELVIKLMTENADIKNIMIKENTKLQQQNYELQKQVLDVCKNSNTISNNTINSNNKTFNLQFFLNEQCKDAMNITDFANSVTLSLEDLENVGSSGYVEGISSIIIKELKGLDIYKRPVHCSDAKRETLYVKDEDKWEKECSENKKIKKVIKNVEHKNIKMISKWTEEHPKFLKSTDIDNDQYLHIVQAAMGGPGDIEKNGIKIVKKIAQEVIIEK